MFEKLLEKIIESDDEMESKLLSIFEGKSWEYIAKALYQILDDVDTADDMCRENAEAFRSIVMKLQAKKNRLLYSPDGYTIKSVVEMDEEELQKHGFDVKADGKKFAMVGGVSGVRESIREFFERKSNGKDEEYLIAFAQSRFAPSKLSDVLCKEAKVNETIADRIWDFLRENPDSTFNEILDGIDVTGEDAGKFGDVVKDMLNKSIYVEDGRYHLVKRLKENLTAHARRELELAGMFDKEVEGSEATGSWNILCAEAVIELMEVFAEQGHSGFSASMTQELFSRLARYEKLTELTDNIDEWMDVHEYCSDGPDMWQSQRSPSCFSEDGGKTYWDIDEDWNKHEDEDGSIWSGGLSKEEWGNRPIHQSKHIEKKEQDVSKVA